MRILRPSGYDDGAHRHSERGIHQLLSGLAETLATVSWLQRELLRRGQEALVVRLNFVFCTDSVSELYGQRMYVILCTRSHCVPNMPRRAQSGRRTSFGIRVGFIESCIVATVCLSIYLCLRYKVYSYPVKQTKSYSTKRKENNRHFPPEIIFVFCDHTIHHVTCTSLLLDCQRQCSNYFVCR
jgi:hypothetical protein